LKGAARVGAGRLRGKDGRNMTHGLVTGMSIECGYGVQVQNRAGNGKIGHPIKGNIGDYIRRSHKWITYRMR